MMEHVKNTLFLFLLGLKEKEMCIMNASENFQACYNKTVLPSLDDSDEERAKKECW